MAKGETEIFCDFDLVNKGNNNDPIVTAHIAEGPGGFLEALVNYRKNSNDKILTVRNIIRLFRLSFLSSLVLYISSKFAIFFVFSSIFSL